MSVQKLDIFTSDKRLRVYEQWRIYALFCVESKTSALVKIGVSSIIYDRLLTLHAGLPFPIGVVLHAQVGHKNETMRLESALHRAFKHRNTRGEWFRFDMSDPDTKFEFHHTMRSLFNAHTGRALKWQKILPEQLRAYAALRSKRKT